MSSTTPDFTLLHATYGRPEKAIAAMRMALERAVFPKYLEYIFAINEDDETRWKFSELIMASNMETGFTSRAVIDNFAGSAPAWDAAANESTGEILIQMQDDLELPENWDIKLGGILYRNFGDIPIWENPPPSAFIATSNGFRKDALCCTALMTRARYKQCGEFLHAGYQSVFSDDDVTYRAMKDARDGKCKFIDARELVFLHRHHYHDKTVPMDATYERENSAEAYRLGAELFAKRNPEAAIDGLVTWR